MSNAHRTTISPIDMARFAESCCPLSNLDAGQRHTRIYRKFPTRTLYDWGIETSFYDPNVLEIEDKTLVSFFDFMCQYRYLLEVYEHKETKLLIPVPPTPDDPIKQVPKDMMELERQDNNDLHFTGGYSEGFFFVENDIKDALDKLPNKEIASVTHVLLQYLSRKWISTLPSPNDRTQEQEALIVRRAGQCKNIGALYGERLQKYLKELGRIERIKADNDLIEKHNRKVFVERYLKQSQVQYMKELWVKWFKEEPFNRFPIQDFKWTIPQKEFINEMQSLPEYSGPNYLSDVSDRHLGELMSFHQAASSRAFNVKGQYHTRWSDKYVPLPESNSLSIKITTPMTDIVNVLSKTELLALLFEFNPDERTNMDLIEALKDLSREGVEDYEEIVRVFRAGCTSWNDSPELARTLTTAIRAQKDNRIALQARKMVLDTNEYSAKRQRIEQAHKIIAENLTFKQLNYA